jgi:hypothetical protein
MANNCATAYFPYQGRASFYGGSPNQYFQSTDNVNPSTGKRTMGELAAYVISQTIATGTVGAIWDNVGAIMGGVPSLQPPIATILNSMDYGCAPLCGTPNALMISSYTPAYAELRTVVKAQQGSSYVIDYNSIDANGAIPAATFLGQTGDVYNGEFFVNNIPLPHSMRFQTADDTLSTNNTHGAVDYLQFIEGTRWQYSDAGGIWHLWDEGDRGPMMVLGEFYMADAWCNSTRANCFNGAASVYNYTGLSWGTSPSATYVFTDEVWVYTTASGTLSTALPAAPSGFPYDIYLSDDTNVTVTGGPIYATNYEFEICLVSDTSFQHCDKFPAQKIGARHYQTLNLSSLGYQPVINSYPIGSIVRFATTAYRHTGTNPVYSSVGKNWSLWWPAMGVDIGKPDPAGYNSGVRSCGTTCATTALVSPPASFILGVNNTCIGHAGTSGCDASTPSSCAHGTTHGDIWRRDFVNTAGQHNVVLVADYGTYFCTDDFNWHGKNIDMSTACPAGSGCSYQQLHSDGSLSAAASTYNMPAGSAFILMQAAGGPPPPSLSITSSACPNGTVGLPYNCYMTATGGTLPYVWSIISGSLPAWATLNTVANVGVVSGTPISTGTASFTEEVTDATPTSVPATNSITVNPLTIQVISITGNTSVTGTVCIGPCP